MNYLKKQENKHQDYKKLISGFTVTAVLFLVDIYLALQSNGWDLNNLLLFIDNTVLRVIALVVLQMLILGASYGIIYGVISAGYKLVWKLRHRECYLHGTWLHIHDKEKVRIGVVSIEQDFYNLQVSALNIKPNAESTTQSKTNWYYIGSEFRPDDAMGDNLVGCYLANRNNESIKYGVHIFKNVTVDKKGYPIKMEGDFGDIVKNNGTTTVDASDKMGRLYLFKISKREAEAFKPYINNQNKLNEITKDTNPIVTQSDFFKTLTMVLNKNQIQNRHKLVLEQISNSPQKYITKKNCDEWLAKILCSVALSDMSINHREVDLLNSVIGTSWEEHYIKIIFEQINQPNADKESLATVIAKVKEADFPLWSAIRDLSYKASAYIVECDGIVTDKERVYSQLLDKIFQ